MDLIQLIVLMAVVGLILWLVTSYVPMPQPVKTVIVAIVVIVLCLFLLNLFGIGTVHVGR